MTLRREGGGATLIDVLDRILDKGIVVDAWVRVSLMGIDFLLVEARLVIASFETYLDYAETLALSRLVAAPPSTVPTRRENRSAESGHPTRHD
jgi:gas vesicle structural protein